MTNFHKEQRRSFYNLHDTPSLQVTNFQKEQRRSFYNEFVLDPKHWIRHLPDVIEAYFVMDDEHNVERGLTTAAGSHVVEAARAFREAYHLDAAEAPLLTLHPERWEPGPFA